MLQRLRQRFGSHALAILFHGSCRRARDDTGGIVDLYVLVDDYRSAYGRVLPDLWMEHATGRPVVAEPMLEATEAALRAER